MSPMMSAFKGFIIEFTDAIFYGILSCNAVNFYSIFYHLSLILRKPVFRVSDLVRHKPGCTATEDSLRLEISDLGNRGIVLVM